MAPSNTTAPLPTGGPTAGGDEFDDLFDYDIDGENDPFSENYNVPGAKEVVKESANAGKSSTNLGIDEEIEITRKPRAPRVKLDEQRLLSANGIPKLRKKAKDHLKLKGKGHEYSDASRLLAFYQLWLDDLFPKARFLDALAMVEKMGHKKVLQVARMEWIDEGKPRSGDQDDTLYDDPIVPTRENGDQEQTASRIAPIFEKTATARPKTPTLDVDEDMDMDDLYGATPKPVTAAAGQSSIFGGGPANSGPKQTSNFDEGMDDDDLDALLAEEDAMNNLVAGKKQPIIITTKTKPTGFEEEMDEDELDALLAEEDALRAAPVAKKLMAPVPKTNSVPDEFDDEMEAMAEMDGMW